MSAGKTCSARVSLEGEPSPRNPGQFRTRRVGAANGVPVLLHVPHIHTARALRLGGRAGDAALSPARDCCQALPWWVAMAALTTHSVRGRHL